LTKAVFAMAVTVAAVSIGGYVAPLILLGVLVIPTAIISGVFVRATRLSFLVTLPLAVSVILVSVFTRPGETVLLEAGPIRATLEGAGFAAQVVTRLFVMAMTLIVFGLTTDARSMVVDLERRGASPRLTFAVAAALEAVPALLARGRTIVAAQRARGLDTEGSVGARLRGFVPLLGPVVLSGLAEVEERSLALDARGFGRPGRRDPIWAPADSPAQGAARWLLVAGLVGVLVMRATGTLAGLP
jgi:energy-coupling factor transport system permease protein